MKKQPEITIHMQEDLLKKFLYISEAEGRTPNNQFIFMLKNNIQYFERTKGKTPHKFRFLLEIGTFLLFTSQIVRIINPVTAGIYCRKVCFVQLKMQLNLSLFSKFCAYKNHRQTGLTQI